MLLQTSTPYADTLILEGSHAEELLILAVDALAALNWKLGRVSDAGFIAYTTEAGSGIKLQMHIVIKYPFILAACISSGLQITDHEHDKEIVQRLFSKCIELKQMYSFSECAERYNRLRPTLVSSMVSGMVQPPTTVREDLKEFAGILRARKDYIITPVIMDLNILIFLARIISGVHAFTPERESLIRLGASYTPLIANGEWWRLLTCCFIHIGLLHLLANMFALYYIGSILEPILKNVRFILAYLTTGVVASLTSYWWHERTVVSAGASGAIFGLYGVFLALLTVNVVDRSLRGPLFASIGIFVLINLIGGMKQGIDNAAHVGGLLCGIVLGYLFTPGLKQLSKTD